MSRKAEKAGAQYAQDQIESDYFMQWVYEQLVEASRMDPSDVLPLETKRDAEEIAHNMLRDLEHDTKRALSDYDISRLVGADVSREDVKAFYEGFRDAAAASLDWLADELLELNAQIRGEVREGRRGAREAAQPRRRLPPSKDIPIPAIPTYEQGDPKANYAIETLVAQGGRRVKWRFDSGYYATLDDAIAMSENLILFGEVGWYKGVRVVDVRRGYKPVWEWPEKWGRSWRGIGEGAREDGRRLGVSGRRIEVPMDYTQATERRDELEAEVDRTSRALKALSGGGPLGLTPDDVRATPEWKAAKRAADDAFAALQAFNKVYVRRFKQEIKRDRQRRRR